MAVVRFVNEMFADSVNTAPAEPVTAAEVGLMSDFTSLAEICRIPLESFGVSVAICQVSAQSEIQRVGRRVRNGSNSSWNTWHVTSRARAMRLTGLRAPRGGGWG